MASLSATTDAFVESLAAMQVLAKFFTENADLQALLRKWRAFPLLQVNAFARPKMLAEFRPLAMQAYYRYFGRSSTEVVKALLTLAQVLPDGRMLLPASKLTRANLLDKEGRMLYWLLLAYCIEFGQQPKVPAA